MGGLGDGERPPQSAREPRRFDGEGSELVGGIADGVVSDGLLAFAFAVLRVAVAISVSMGVASALSESTASSVGGVSDVEAMDPVSAWLCISSSAPSALGG